MSAYRFTITNSGGTASVDADATSTGAPDGTMRVVVSTDSFGRGLAVTIAPLTADAQFVLQSVTTTVVPSLSGPDDL